MLLIFCHLVPQLDQMSSAGCQSRSVVLLYVSPEGKCRTVKKKFILLLFFPLTLNSDTYICPHGIWLNHDIMIFPHNSNTLVSFFLDWYSTVVVKSVVAEVKCLGSNPPLLFSSFLDFQCWESCLISLFFNNKIGSKTVSISWCCKYTLSMKHLC